MLVGEVRCAVCSWGASWWLSTGSHWSPGPTNVSKNSQVRRASRRNRRRSGGARGRSRVADGWLNQRATSGAISHAPSNGSADESADGRCQAMSAKTIADRSGDQTISRHKRARSVRRSSPREVIALLVHCRR